MILSPVVASYVNETKKLAASPSSTEATFYPDIKTLLSAILKSADFLSIFVRTRPKAVTYRILS